MRYDIYQHRHNFAVWAAARASQRRLTTVDTLRKALESSEVVAFVRDQVSEEIDSEVFAAKHRSWCEEIVRFLLDAGVMNATFGRAAKLVAVYLKSMVVIGPFADSDLARVAHPPIDRILLRNLARAEGLEVGLRTMLRTTNWTDLDRVAYYALIEALPKLVPFWKLEEYWTVTEAE
jgi:hypothetical protein